MPQIQMHISEFRNLENCIKCDHYLLPELGDECLIRLNHRANYIRAVYDPRMGPGDGIFMTQNFHFTQYCSHGYSGGCNKLGVVEFAIITYKIP